MKENMKLRTELAAQQAVYQKLKQEKDRVNSILDDAKEEIRYIYF